jgi:hypothetical protein
MTALRKFVSAALTLSLPLSVLAQATPPAAEPAKPAAAPPPLVQVYGTLNVNLQYTEAGDATAGAANDVQPRFAVSIDSSNVGVRGTLKLNDAVSAIYQCETGASVDGEAGAVLCNRNSRIGLQGFFGTVFLGNWDTPYKSGAYGTKADDVFGNTDVFGFNGIMGSPGYGTRSVGAFNAAIVAAQAAAFDVRGGNSVAYWSPKIANLVSFKLQWAVDEFRNASNAGAGAAVDPMLLSGAVNLDMGPLSVVAEAEYHEDAFGIRAINAANASNNAAKDLGLRLAAGYELPLGVGALRVMGMFERLMYEQENAGAGFKDYSRLAWLLGASFRTGPHELRGRFSQAMDPDITAADGTSLPAGAEDNLAAQSYAVGYAYHIAKSTQLYAFFTQIMNDDAARYTFPVSGNAAVVAMAAGQAGADPTAGGIGIRHAF